MNKLNLVDIIKSLLLKYKSIKNDDKIHKTNGGNWMKVLVCDDNKSFAGIVGKFLSSQDNMEIVDIAINGKEAVDKIIKNKPDVVLLDLVMPELDGLGVIEKLVENNIEKMPRIILQSAISQEFVIKEALELGAYCFMLKPYELPVLADRVKTAYNDTSVASMNFIVPPYGNESIEFVKSNETLDAEVEVTNLMHKVGIPANISGHQFLREAILRVIDDRGLITGITKELYPDVAKKYKTSAAKVERSIRHAIEVCWLRGRIDVLENIFGYAISAKRGKPTNSEFIAMIADKIRMDLRMIARL